MRILAIESSCDETSAAVVEDGTHIISNVIATSSAMHEKWGGIVPEVAAREQLKSIIPVIIESLSPFTMNHEPSTINHQYASLITAHIDAIAVTVGPGLIGSLLIGIETAKTIAFITGKPIIPVNHVLAHMYANWIHGSEFIVHSQKGNTNDKPSTMNPEPSTTIQFPAISLVVSGGHTELFLMTTPKDLKWLGGTIDDAAGEAFDKTARLLGFGSRGGLAIQEAASMVDSSGFMVHGNNKNSEPSSMNHQPLTINPLPRPLLHDDTLNFSFSGLKTAILRAWNKYSTLSDNNRSTTVSHEASPRSGMNDERITNAFAFEVQEAITDVLVAKTLKAAGKYAAKSILLSGGVASNLRLREKFRSNLESRTPNPVFHVPPVSLCTDNAAYIASYAYFRGQPADWHTLDARPDLTVEI